MDELLPCTRCSRTPGHYERYDITTISVVDLCVDCCEAALAEVVKGVADCLLDDTDSAQAVLAALDAAYGPDMSGDTPIKARALMAYAVALRALGLL
jgi:hypothetical protein